MPINIVDLSADPKGRKYEDMKHTELVNECKMLRTELSIACMEGEKDQTARIFFYKQLEWLWRRCKIIVFPGGMEYPIEHAPLANKNRREHIEALMFKEIQEIQEAENESKRASINIPGDNKS